MRLLKLVIVDDEKIILQGMTTTFDWASIGFQIVGTALSGAEALKIIEEEIPDVVITDIRMKKMDGITLMEKTKMISPGIRFVVLSAYRDFEYAQKACSLGAVDYIVKPVNDEMMLTMKKVYDQCLSEKIEQDIFDQWQEFFINNREGFCTYLIEQYLKKKISLEEIRAKDIAFSREEMEEHYYTVLCIDVDMIYKIKDMGGFSEKQFAMLSYYKNKIGEHYHTWMFTNPDGAGIFVADLDKEDGLDKFKWLIDEAGKELGFHAIYAVSPVYIGFEGMEDAYYQCMELYDLECEMEVKWNEEIQSGGTSAGYPDEVERSILASIRKKQDDNLKESFILFLAALGGDEETDKLMLHQLVVHMEFYLAEQYKEEETIRLHFQEVYKAFSRYSASVCFRMCYELGIYLIREWVEREVEERRNEYVDIACEYMEAHLDEEGLSLGRVAKEVHLNAVYFGRVFKSVKNMSFRQYLIRRKIVRAKELLRSTDASIMEISWSVGISNASYFTKLFKQMEGLLPSEYRNSHI